jgi:hypothetical protein
MATLLFITSNAKLVEVETEDPFILKVMVTGYDPTIPGVPNISPVALFSAIPLGNVPLETAKFLSPLEAPTIVGDIKPD